MKPFSYKSQVKAEKIFSYRLSRARRVVENAFGILANRFRVLLHPINLPPDKVEKVVLACTTLHNFLNSESRDIYMPTSDLQRENFRSSSVIDGCWTHNSAMVELQGRSTGAANAAKDVRTQFMKYFN